jgi:HPt (histidine-containing phosphotransfer) domain-containing protein
MTTPDPRVLAALAELREQYARELPPLVVALAATLARLGVDESALADAKGKAHRLRGTAGSYGFHSMSEAAAVLEQALDTPEPDGAIAIEAALAEVFAALPTTEA